MTVTFINHDFRNHTSIPFALSHPISLGFILILFSNLHNSTIAVLFPQGFSSKISYSFIGSRMCTIYLMHFTLLIWISYLHWAKETNSDVPHFIISFTFQLLNLPLIITNISCEGNDLNLWIIFLLPKEMACECETELWS